MKPIHLRPVKIEQDFGPLAELFTLEDEPATEASLKKDYEAHKPRILRVMVAEDAAGQLLGFNWATQSRFDATEVYFYVIVKPQFRRQGIGVRLYEDIWQAVKAVGATRLKVSFRDDNPDARTFAERRGFAETGHSLAMELDLDTFDDKPYEALIKRLQSEGFRFTTMGELGNTTEAQQTLYALNDMTSSETPGSEGVHAWLSFEDFQKSVCKADWYKPDGQFVIIDSSTGEWVGMSAITRFEGADYAYNLHTGVEKRHRGHKLAQAVKVLALRYAREELHVHKVCTHHNVLNAPMIAIDHKFGYVQKPGIFRMEKTLT